MKIIVSKDDREKLCKIIKFFKIKIKNWFRQEFDYKLKVYLSILFLCNLFFI
jgi:hypothetical protein